MRSPGTGGIWAALFSNHRKVLRGHVCYTEISRELIVASRRAWCLARKVASVCLCGLQLPLSFKTRRKTLGTNDWQWTPVLFLLAIMMGQTKQCTVLCHTPWMASATIVCSLDGQDLEQSPWDSWPVARGTSQSSVPLGWPG